MDTYKIIENIELKIKNIESKIKKAKTYIYFSLSFMAAFLISAITFLIIYFVLGDKINLVISISSFSLLIIVLALFIFLYYSIKEELTTIKILKESLKSWENKKPFKSEGPLRVPTNKNEEE